MKRIYWSLIFDVSVIITATISEIRIIWTIFNEYNSSDFSMYLPMYIAVMMIGFIVIGLFIYRFVQDKKKYSNAKL